MPNDRAMTHGPETRVRLIGRDRRFVGYAVVPAWGPDILKIGQRLFCPDRNGVYREATIYTDFTALPFPSARSGAPRKRRLIPQSPTEC